MRPKNYNRLKQPTPKELTDSCLAFLQTKFYTEPGDDKCFAQDRSKLLSWVVLWPAGWLNSRAVTIHGDAYREIFIKVFMNAAAHMESKVKYRPAYLRQVIQSHWRIHGEDYYDQAKAVRNLVDHTLMIAGQSRLPAPDPVRQMAEAAKLLRPVKRPVKTAVKAAVEQELNLL
ncbi:MAG: hypothetical protein WCH99_05050 [Verrucomicrobiota bacterium]